MIELPRVFVGNVGLKSITICGVESHTYLTLPNSRRVRDAVVIQFNNEIELIDMLQLLVDKSVPFESTTKSQALDAALFYKNNGKIKGNVIGFDWGLNGAIYSNV